MAIKTTGVRIYINDKEVINSAASIQSAIKKLNNEMKHMIIGSAEYNERMSKLKTLNNMLKEHKDNIGQTASAWSRMMEMFKATLASNVISGLLEGLASKVQGFFSMTLNGFSDFEKGFSSVLTNINDADTEKFGESMKNGVKDVMKLGIGMDDANKAMYEAVSASVKAGDAVKFLNDASKLSIGGVTNLAASYRHR